MDALTSRRSASFIAVAALALTAACGDSDQRGSLTAIRPATSLENRVFTQRERLGNPLVSEVMIHKSHHHEHNTGQPSTDVGDFSDDLTAFVTGVAGRDPAYANAIAGALLPDVLVTYPKRDNVNPATPVFWLSWVFGGYGGRRLTDDVVDIGLGAIFGSLLGNTTNVSPGLTTDNVGSNDVTFGHRSPILPPPISRTNTFVTEFRDVRFWRGVSGHGAGQHQRNKGTGGQRNGLD